MTAKSKVAGNLTSEQRKSPARLPKLSLPLRTTLLYLLFGCLWILLSDQLLALFVPDHAQQVIYQTFKGWFFILTSGILLYTLLLTDLAARKQFEEALRESEERFSKAFYESPIGIILVDMTDNTIRDVNDTILEMIGLPREQVIGQNDRQLGFQIDPEVYQVIGRELSEQGMFRNKEIRVRLPNGELRHVLNSGALITIQGKPYNLALLQDITERKQAEEALSASEERYRLIAQNAEDMIWTMNLDFRLTYVSPGVERALGYSAEEILSTPSERFLTPESYAVGLNVFREEVDAAQLQPDPNYARVLELEYRRRNGDTFWVEMKFSLFRASNGQPTGVLGVGRDITERKRAEQETAWLASFPKQNPNPIVEIDSTGAVFYMNPEAQRRFPDLPTQGFKHPWLAGLETVVDRFQRGEIGELNREIQIGDAWYSQSPYYVADVARLRVYGADITERKRAEVELQRTSHWLLASQRISATGGWAINLKTGKVWASPEARRIYGIDDRELTLPMIQAFPLPQYRQVLNSALQELIDHGTAYDIEFQIAHGINDAIVDLHSLAEYEATEHVILGVVRDITDQKQAEQALRASEERFRLLFENNHTVMLLIEPVSGAIKDANRAAAQYYGYSLAELRVMNINDINQLTPDEVKAERMRALKEERNFFNFQHRLSNGEIRSVEVHSTPIEVDSNTFLFSIVVDNTERKQAEEALRESQEQMAGIFNSAMDAIVSADEHQRILIFNPAAETMFRCSQAEAIGQPLERFIPLRFRNSHTSHMQNFAETGATNRTMGHLGIIYGLRSDGEEFPIEASISKIHMAGHDLFTVILRDITERKQAEDQIQRQLKRLNALHMIDIAISSSFDLNIILEVVLQQVLSRLGVDAGAVILFNTQLQTIEYAASRGFRSNAIQRTKLRLGEGYASQAVLKRKTVHISGLMETGGKLAKTLQLAHEEFTDYYGTPLIVKGEVKGVLEIYHRSHLRAEPEWLEFLETLAGQTAIAIDNTQLFESLQRSNFTLERRVAERTAELNQTNMELEHASKVKDEFLANMSHELRTPLTSILGLSESLLEQRRGSLDDHQQRSLEIIESSGQHLLELINDVLDLSKIEAGKFDYYPQPISVDEICQSSLSFVKSLAAKKSILVTHIQDIHISRIYADPRRLKQMLVNLLTNAVKFTGENGEVILQVKADPEQDLIKFSVIDNGIGIAPEDLRRLFQPFVQVDSSLNRRHEGTGLGLALVQKLVDLHGGSIQVESEVGRGSRFTINLPCLQRELEKLESDPTLATGAQTENAGLPGEAVDLGVILLADDNLPSILSIGEYLESRGYEVVAAHDGLEAIQKAEIFKPDIILMDIQMPSMNGWEAIAHLRGNPQFETTPIIALTALAMPGDRERSLLAGANEYMSKPVGLKLLAGTIHEMLRRQTP